MKKKKKTKKLKIFFKLKKKKQKSDGEDTGGRKLHLFFWFEKILTRANLQQLRNGRMTEENNYFSFKGRKNYLVYQDGRGGKNFLICFKEIET